MTKNYTTLHRGLVIKHYWQVIQNFKTPFFLTIFCSALAAGLDIYIPLKFLELWNVLSVNDFSFVEKAKSIIIIILILGIVRWLIRRTGGFLNSYFQTNKKQVSNIS